MKDEFRSKLEEKKKEIDDYISKANDENARNTFLTLRKELDKINSINDLESRIASAVNFKSQAKKDSTRAVFEVFEKELNGLRSSLPKGIAPETKEAVEKTSIPAGEEKKPLLLRPEEISKYIKEGKQEVAMVTLTDIHRMVKKSEPPEHIRKTDEKVRRVRHAARRLPELVLDMEAIREHVQGHEEFRKEMKSSEDHIHEKVKDVMDSLTSLRSHLSKRMKEKKIEEHEKDRLLDDTSKKLNTKVDIITKKLEESLDMLSRKIEESSAVNKMEMAGNINFLKSQIDEIKTQLPKYAKKEEVKEAKKEQKARHPKRKIKEAPPAVMEPTAKPPGEKPFEGPVASFAPEKKEPEKATEKTVKIKDMAKHKGKEITVECGLELTKKVEEGDARMYGYILKDGTGEVMLTSTEEIKGKKARIRCIVSETPSGRIYLRFTGIAR